MNKPSFLTSPASRRPPAWTAWICCLLTVPILGPGLAGIAGAQDAPLRIVQLSDTTDPYAKSRPAISPNGSVIAFVRDMVDIGEVRLFSVQDDGTDLRPISPEGASVYLGGSRSVPIRWGNDWIAFRACDPNGCDTDGIHVVHPDGTSFTTLVEGPIIFRGGPAISPDGTKVAFVAFDRASARDQLVVRNVDGTPTECTPPGVPALGGCALSTVSIYNGNFGPLALSADGAKIVFGRYETYVNELLIASTNGGGLQTIPTGDDNGGFIDVALSADATTVAYTYNAAGGLAIYVSNIDGTDRSLIEPTYPGGPADGALSMTAEGGMLCYHWPSRTRYQFDVFLVDLETGTRTNLTETPAGYSSSHPQISADGSAVAFLSNADFDSGANPDGNAEVFLAVLAEPLPTARGWLGSATVGNVMYAVGGADDQSEVGTTEAYDASVNIWTAANPLTHRRWGLTVAASGGRLYAIGGTSGCCSQPSSSNEEYDPATDTWGFKADMPTPRWKLTSAVVNGRIYAIGGGPSGNQNLSTNANEEFDPTSNAWAAKAPMPTVRWGAAGATLAGRVYVYGGYAYRTSSASYGSVGALEIYDPATDSWALGTDMPTPRWDLAGVELNGLIYAIGGWDPASGQPPVPFATVEAYDPSTDTWSAKASMIVPRTGLTAAVTNGKIYAFGGWDGTRVRDTLEEYDPATDTWRVVSPGLPTPGCSLQCTASAPPVGVVGIPLQFNATATPVGCADPPTFEWDFGDGSTDSRTQSPTHAYASTGTFDWQLEVAANGASCQQSGGISISWPAFVTFGPDTRSGYASEPVNTATGNYVYQRTDLTVPARGLPLLFSRTYNSQDRYSGPLGHGWTHSYNIILAEDVGGTARIKWGDGHEDLYAPQGGGTYTSWVPGVFNTLVKNGDGTFTLTQKNRTQHAFSSAGRLSRISDRNGNALSLAYDTSGNLTTITDSGGRVITLAYDAENRITQLTDPIGRTLQYGYDASGNLTVVANPAGGLMAFSYDSRHQVTQILDEGSGVLLLNTYDASGRVLAQTNGRGYTTTFAYDRPSLGDTTITDPMGNSTVHSHDSQLRLIQITDATGYAQVFAYDAQNNRTSVTNQNGDASLFSYDTRGNLTSIEDPLSNQAAFTYDAANNFLTATNPLGNTTAFTYDSNGNLVSITDALGNTATFAYDTFGQLVTKTDARDSLAAFAYDSFGNVTSVTDPLGNKTVLTYDGIGRLLSITDPNGHTSTATYDALGWLVKISDPLGHQTTFAYDAVGNLLTLTDANSNVTSYAYDAVSNLETVKDALGKVTRYAYDANNNRVSVINANGNTTTHAYDALNRLTSVTDPLAFGTCYTYDGVGNVLAVTDAKGQVKQFTYDASNRLLGISYADGQNVSYAYDANGNRTSMVDPHGTTTYSHDDLDRLTAVTDPGGTVGYTYDEVGNRTTVAYPDGKVVSYTYDAANRLSQATDWLNRTSSYSYDPASNLIGVSYAEAGMAFMYDGANRLLHVVNNFKNEPGEHDDPNPASRFTYALDPVGNRLSVTDGAGKLTTYGYDALYQLTSATVGGKTTHWTYDAVGNRLTETAPGRSVTYSYDAADRLLAAGDTTFTYDANGSRITQTKAWGTLAYTYDAANRLTAVIGGGQNSSFDYDGDGSRVSQTVGAGTYTYVNDVATALPLVLQESGPDGGISYAYGLGLTSESGPGFDYFYHFDGLGSVAALTNPAGKLRQRYVYGPWGETLRRIPAPRVGTKNKLEFAGEALDPGTGLYYLRARYYDSALGRFLSRDPTRGFPSLPLSQSRYGYSGSNPARLKDPLGLSWVDTVFGLTDLRTDYKAAREAKARYQQCIDNIETCENPEQVHMDREQSIVKVGVSAHKTGVSVAQLQFKPYFLGLKNPLPRIVGYAEETISLFRNTYDRVFRTKSSAESVPVSTSPQVDVLVTADGSSVIVPALQQGSPAPTSRK